MKFGITFFSIIQTENDNIYELLLKASKYADNNGFSAVWIPERHFGDFGGHFPNPSVLCAGLATITQNLALRAGSVISPLHDVLRIAEEWSVIDNLSHGRSGLAFGSGWNPDDFVLAPENYLKRHKKMYSQIEQLKQLWSGEGIERSNGKSETVFLKHWPNPKQKMLPIWLSISSNEESFKSAGRLGLNIYTHLIHQTMDELEKNISIYKHSRELAGFDPESGNVTVMLHTFIGDGKHEEALNIAEKPLKEYLGNIVGFGGVRATNAKNDKAIELYKDELIDLSYKKFVNGRSLIGNIEYCHQIFDKLSKIGVHEVASLIDFGINENLVMESLKNLKKYFIGR